jgi:hypothetical protein
MTLQFGADGNPVIDQLSEEGFVDLTLRIVELIDQDTHYRFHLAASYDNLEVGFDVILVKGIQSGFDSNADLMKDHVYYRGVTFLRSGEESDRLVAAIGHLYAADPPPKKMVAEESFTAIALHQGDLDFENECVKLKLFGKDSEPFDEDAYYESFFNVDLSNRVVYWNEKDPDYREPLLRALAAE